MKLYKHLSNISNKYFHDFTLRTHDHRLYSIRYYLETKKITTSKIGKLLPTAPITTSNIKLSRDIPDHLKHTCFELNRKPTP